MKGGITMNIYEITFTCPKWEGTYSSNIVKANSAEKATAYYEAEGYTVAGCREFRGTPKPGQPITIVE